MRRSNPLFSTRIRIRYRYRGKPRQISYPVRFYSHLQPKIQFHEKGEPLGKTRLRVHRVILVEAGVGRTDFLIQLYGYVKRRFDCAANTIEAEFDKNPPFWK